MIENYPVLRKFDDSVPLSDFAATLYHIDPRRCYTAIEVPEEVLAEARANLKILVDDLRGLRPEVDGICEEREFKILRDANLLTRDWSGDEIEFLGFCEYYPSNDWEVAVRLKDRPGLVLFYDYAEALHFELWSVPDSRRHKAYRLATYVTHGQGASFTLCTLGPCDTRRR